MIPLFFFYLILAGIITLYLTHLHRKFFEYKALLEMVIHLVRSYLIFAILTIPGIYFYFSFISIGSFVICLLACLGVHLLLNSLYLFSRKGETINSKSADNNPVNSSVSIQNQGFSKFVPNDNFITAVEKLLIENKRENILQNGWNEEKDLIINGINEIYHKKDLESVFCLFYLHNVPYLNKFLLRCYDSLSLGGILVFKIQTLEIKKEALNITLGKNLLRILYPLYFIFFRVFPKLRYFNNIYFFITRGKNRWISKTEIFGRLNYCGFDVSFHKLYNDGWVVVAQKDHAPSVSKSPSYYPVIKLDRVGYGGRIIKVHKIRTMFPYSEFLQKKVYEENQMATTGKFKNDYRITTLGKIFRKYWIDELPQFLEWLRGDIKIVGIRAMSKHYFSLYPSYYQELYMKVKPGLVSPLFDEDNSGFEEIVNIEKKYLESFVKHPLRTDFFYFFSIFHQILFKGTRSK